MDDRQTLALWMRHVTEDSDLAAELALLSAGKIPADDRFGGELAFGTGGLRGKIGAGSNRMNIYTVRKATQGLAAYLLSGPSMRRVVIAYDTRIKSDLFAVEAARVLAANGVDVLLFPEPVPTPVLSFAVRHLGCGAGVCITASHNPAQYNGYKVYGSDGCQITLEAAEEIGKQIARADSFSVEAADYDKAVTDGRIQSPGGDVIRCFLREVKALRLETGDVPLNVVYTPLNGAGLACVMEILAEIGVRDVTIVPEQKFPDGNFPTCPYPNPEEPSALEKGLSLSRKLRPDLLLATDPDCDRVGVAIPQGEDYGLLTGNEVGVLLFDYICGRRSGQGTLPQNPVAIKTIVTTDMACSIATKYGVELREVLTGFKFIGEQIGLLEQAGEAHRYVFGFEESCGYLAGAYARDKDAVAAVMLVCDMAYYYKQKGMTLQNALDELYKEHGRWETRLVGITFDGPNGAENMKRILRGLREAPPKQFGGLAVQEVKDYLCSERGLPKADVLEFLLEGRCKVIFRPSGTEPKVKAYISARADDAKTALSLCAALVDACNGKLAI